MASMPEEITIGIRTTPAVAALRRIRCMAQFSGNGEGITLPEALSRLRGIEEAAIMALSRCEAVQPKGEIEYLGR